VFSTLVFTLTLFLSQWGQPWTSISLKKLALSLLRDQLALAFDRGVFNEPVPRMVIYVPDHPGAPRGIFIADERTAGDARVIVADRYSILSDPGTNQVGIRLQNGTIHRRPYETEQDHQVMFSSYDLKIPVDQRLYAPIDERPSRQAIIAQLNQSNWRDTAALRRLMEYYKDLAFPTAALIFGMLGIPAGIVSKRSGRIGGFAAGVMIIVIYYVLNVLCEFLVTTLLLPPFAGAWLPNALFLVTTVVLFYRVSRQ
jgi:lipopolysaccharide export system permease protein